MCLRKPLSAFITDSKFLYRNPAVTSKHVSHCPFYRFPISVQPTRNLVMSTPLKTAVERPPSMTHDSILEFLLQKNLQFQRGAETGNRIQNESQPVYREELARGGQAPIATVVTCCDSRVVPEIIFQQGFGKLFIVRTAGGVVWSPPVLGSIQFGVETFKTPLLMVLGHTECGAAITGWTICQEKGKMHELSPSLQALVEPMEHLVDSISKEHPSRELSTQTASRKLSEAIAKDGVRRILNELSSLRKLTETGQLGVVSGIYDVHDGSVTIMEKSWEKVSKK